MPGASGHVRPRRVGACGTCRASEVRAAVTRSGTTMRHASTTNSHLRLAGRGYPGHHPVETPAGDPGHADPGRLGPGERRAFPLRNGEPHELRVLGHRDAHDSPDTEFDTVPESDVLRYTAGTREPSNGRHHRPSAFPGAVQPPATQPATGSSCADDSDSPDAADGAAALSRARVRPGGPSEAWRRSSRAATARARRDRDLTGRCSEYSAVVRREGMLLLIRASSGNDVTFGGLGPPSSDTPQHKISRRYSGDPSRWPVSLRHRPSPRARVCFSGMRKQSGSATRTRGHRRRKHITALLP